MLIIFLSNESSERLSQVHFVCACRLLLKYIPENQSARPIAKAARFGNEFFVKFDAIQNTYMNTDLYRNPPLPVNVDPRQRTLSVVAGTLLIFSSVRSKFSVLRALAGGYLLYRGLTGYCALFSALGKKKLPDPVNNILIRSVVRVKRPRHDVYAFWRKLSNLPLFMRHLSSVEEITPTRSRWKMHLIGKIGTVKWEADITREVKDSLIEWDSVPGSPLINAGRIIFEDAGNNETDIHALITYTAPKGGKGDFIAKLIMNPVLKTIVNEDISNVKRYLETGERVTTV